MLSLLVVIACTTPVPGPAGPQGEVGPTGAQGVQGAAGERGTDGADGERGPSGSSAAARTILEVGELFDGTRCYESVDEQTTRPVDACCPGGFEAIGLTSLIGRDKTVCLEQEASGRAVATVLRGSDGAICYEMDEPWACCPEGFTGIGYRDPGAHVLCLED